MVFQDAFTPFLVTSLATTFTARRVTGSLLPYWSLPLLAIVLLLFLYATAVAYTIFLRPRFSPLRHLPEAPQPPVWRRLLKEPSAHHFEKWFQQVPNDGLIRYYGILNIERVLVTSSAYTRQILQIHAYSYEKQYAQRTHLERVGGQGLVWHEGRTHQYLRRALEPAFKSNLIKTAYFTPIAQKTEEMLRLLRETLTVRSAAPLCRVETREQYTAIEMDDIVHKTVFDIMGLVAFGPDMDFQSIFRPELYYNPLKDYRLAFKPSSSNKIRVYTAFFLPTWVVNILPIPFNFTTGRAINKFRQIGRTWIGQQKLSIATSSEKMLAPPVHSRNNNSSSASFIMESVLREGKLSDQGLLEQFSMFQAGGIHSTGAAIMSTLWWLAQPTNLNIQRRLRHEIRTHMRSSDPRTWSTSPKDIFEPCHYLNAVISEVLRLHPPFSWLGRSPNRWMEVGGTMFPPGLSISLSPWAAHRDPSVWGEDACVFRPERWLSQAQRPRHDAQPPSKSDTTTTTTTRTPTLSNLLSFGAGPRRCIAETLAKVELQCVLAALFGRYEFRAVPGVEMPGVTHQSTLAFRGPLNLGVAYVEGWDDGGVHEGLTP